MLRACPARSGRDDFSISKVSVTMNACLDCAAAPMGTVLGIRCAHGRIEVANSVHEGPGQMRPRILGRSWCPFFLFFFFLFSDLKYTVHCVQLVNRCVCITDDLYSDVAKRLKKIRSTPATLSAACISWIWLEILGVEQRCDLSEMKTKHFFLRKMTLFARHVLLQLRCTIVVATGRV